MVTAGIPELGNENREDNIKLGTILGQKAEKTIVLQSIFYKDILNVLGKDAEYQIFKDLNKFWEYAHTLKKTEWLILMQPELTDAHY